MLEGATLREGRGTTRPLELFGAPDIDVRAVIAEMAQSRSGMAQRLQAPGLLVPTDVPQACRRDMQGVFIHAEGAFYDHTAFKPWRVQSLAFKAIRRLYPDYDLWRDFPYEYVFGKLRSTSSTAARCLGSG